MKLLRKQVREMIFLLLFRREFFSGEEMDEQIDFFFGRMAELPDYLFKEGPVSSGISGEDIPKDRDYITDKLHSLLNELSEIDETISKISEGWRLNRLGKVELTILRLAVYEILKDPDIPTGVAINEAVVLTKRYSGEESSRFVNGVLAKLA